MTTTMPLMRGPLNFTFTFAFQPIVDVRLKAIFSYEALVRGTKGEPAAWVLDQVNDENRYRFDQESRVAAIALAARLGMTTKLNINFIPNAAYRPENCIRSTLAAAEEYGFPIDRIIVEVVENEVEIMREYARFGIRTALDDFGNGFADLKLLARFQPDVLKIDSDLVRGIDIDHARQAIVRGIIMMCNDLDVCVLAEGVETPAEFAWLHGAGIDLSKATTSLAPASSRYPTSTSYNSASDRTIDIIRRQRAKG